MATPASATVLAKYANMTAAQYAKLTPAQKTKIINSYNNQQFQKKVNGVLPSLPALIHGVGTNYDKTRGGPGGGVKPKKDPNVGDFTTPFNIKFNLPPHKWSLPVDQSLLNSNWGTSNYASPKHNVRRGMLWYYQGLTSNTDATSINNQITNTQSASTTTPFDSFWGFQFLYNPESLNNVSGFNAAVTPAVTDVFAQNSSLFTGLESFTVSLFIDRRNDFACFNTLSPTVSYSEIASSYYAGNQYPSKPSPAEKMEDQIRDLKKRGTMADIEYIYRAINGSGRGGTKGTWKNALGRETADIGFLTPTAIAFKFGPNPDSLSYVGWVQNMSIQHTYFTEDMIPISSQVDLSVQVFSTSTLGGGS